MKRSSQYLVVQALRESELSHDYEDIMGLGDITERDAREIEMVLNGHLYERFCKIYPSAKDSQIITSNMLESLHQGHDGWTDSDRMVIEMFMVDCLIGLDAT